MQFKCPKCGIWWIFEWNLTCLYCLHVLAAMIMPRFQGLGRGLLKWLLAPRHFFIWLLIGWQHSCQPIRSHVRKWPPLAVILTNNLLNKANPRDHIPYPTPSPAATPFGLCISRGQLAGVYLAASPSHVDRTTRLRLDSTILHKFLSNIYTFLHSTISGLCSTGKVFLHLA